MKKIEFFFDFLSPFSYFAWVNHLQLELKEARTFIYRPVLMGKIFEHWGIKGPGEIPPKRRFMLKTCFRQAQAMGIDFVPPKNHPFNPLYCLRLATYSCAGKEQSKVMAAIWKHIWGEGRAGDDPEQLSHLLDSEGLNGPELLEKAFSKEAKLEVKINTKAALEMEIFGVPSFNLDGEIFWGHDSLKELSFYANNGEKFDQELFLSRILE